MMDSVWMSKEKQQVIMTPKCRLGHWVDRMAMQCPEREYKRNSASLSFPLPQHCPAKLAQPDRASLLSPLRRAGGDARDRQE